VQKPAGAHAVLPAVLLPLLPLLLLLLVDVTAC
jgi:hypothetical protein